MNIDRYDPVFECRVVRGRALGPKPIEPFELKADMSTLAEEPSSLGERIIEKITGGSTYSTV